MKSKFLRQRRKSAARALLPAHEGSLLLPGRKEKHPMEDHLSSAYNNEKIDTASDSSVSVIPSDDKAAFCFIKMVLNAD
jgi:hypothetical protein